LGYEPKREKNSIVIVVGVIFEDTIFIEICRDKTYSLCYKEEKTPGLPEFDIFRCEKFERRLKSVGLKYKKTTTK